MGTDRYIAEQDKSRTDALKLLPEAPETRWTGVREVLFLSWPIILGNMSYTIMTFADKWMVAQLGTDHLAAIGSAGIWSYVTCMFVLGIMSSVTTFVAQSIGRNEKQNCARYVWQGIYVSFGAGVLALIFWPLATPLFHSMGHEAGVPALEITYYRVRLLGYIPMAWAIAIAVFFQGIGRTSVPMRVSLVTVTVNIGLNYLLIFGNFGFPKMGIAGAALGTVIAQWMHVAILQGLFLMKRYHNEYGTRTSWAIDPKRIRELIRLGTPEGLNNMMQVSAWAFFFSFVLGRFGSLPLAAGTIAMSFMMIAMMPVFALNQGIALIAGKWIGAKNIVRAKARTYTTLKMAILYMVLLGGIFVVYGDEMIGLIFSADPEVIKMGHTFLIISALSRAFHATSIICSGGLRGAGDMRWMMYTTLIFSYGVLLPSVCLFAYLYGAYGAWVGLTIHHMILCGVIARRFHSEKWRHHNIFSQTAPAK